VSGSRDSRRPVLAIVGACLLVLAGVAPALAHRMVERTPEAWHAEERLLVVDSDSGEILVYDDGEEIERLSTPHAPLSFARSPDGRLAFVLRGRNTDRDHVTVIDTAYDEETKVARRPFVARTFVGDSPGGVSHGRLPELEHGIAVAEEGRGELLLLDPGELSGLGAAEVDRYELAAPDHYAFVQAEASDGRELLLAGHLAAAGVQVLDATTGEPERWVPGCPVLHGGTSDAAGRRALFGCHTGILVVPVDGDLLDAELLPYPDDGRTAAFHEAADGVRWGTTDGGRPAIHRIDTAAEELEIESVALTDGERPRTALRTSVTPDGARLLVLTHQGVLQIRDARDGALQREVVLSAPFDPEHHEHLDRATSPDLAATDDEVHVSLPEDGRVLTVDLDTGRIERRLRTGGMPTRLLLLGG
jgi:hypothetical protein